MPYCFHSSRWRQPLPVTKLGFKFLLQRNNGNHIAADGYTLNEANQPIKQISHAELAGNVSEVTAATKVTDLISGLVIAEDSPFDFAIVLDSATADSNGRLSATVSTVTTFVGQTYTEVPVSCKLPSAPEKEQIKNQNSRLN